MSTNQPPPTPVSISTEPPRRRRFPVIATTVFIVLGIAAAVGYGIYARRQAQPTAIFVSGKQVAIVQNMAAANRILAEAAHAQLGPAFAALDPIKLQRIVLIRMPFDSVPDSDDSAQAKLTRILKLHVRAYAIMINGKPSIALPTSQDAALTLNLVKEHYVQMPPHTTLLGEPRFVERVVIQRESVKPSRTRASAQEAAPYFWTAGRSKTYVVQSGDRGIKIARINHISLTDLISANPSKDLNKLQLGDILKVEKMPVMLTVEVKKRFERDEKIIENAPDADAGKRHVSYVVTYRNGAEWHRDVTAMTTLQKPRARAEL